MKHLFAQSLTLAADATGDVGWWQHFWLRGAAGNAPGRHTDALFMWLWWLCVIWFVFLMGLMFYFVIKYRRKPGKIAPMSSAHNTSLEIFWTIFPCIFLAYMFFEGFKGYMEKVVGKGDAVEMHLIGKKWEWKLVYPNGSETLTTVRLGAKDVPVFYLPANKPVRLKMNSEDVMHALWIPDYRVKMDVLPNRYTTLWFEPDDKLGDKTLGVKEGIAQSDPVFGAPYNDHWVFCAEYCGDEHSEMAAVIRIIPDHYYQRWLQYIQAPDDMAPEKLGQIKWKIKCSACHTVDGGANTGPTWKDLFGSTRTFTDGTTAVADDNYIRESILTPGVKIVQGFSNQMTIQQLNEREIAAIIAYMKSISTHAPKTAPDGSTDAGAPPATPVK